MRRFLLFIFVSFSLSCESQTQDIENTTLNDDISFSVYGNSISTYEGYIPSDYLTWFTPSKMKVEETWWYQVGESMGWKLCNNSSWSGSRVAYDNDWGYNSYFISPYRLNNLSEKGIPDNILVLAGVNDWRWNKSSLGTIESTDSTDICGAYNLMLKRLKQLYPQTNIYCLSILHIRENGNTEETVNSQGWSIADANVCIKKICANNGVIFINMKDCDFSDNVTACTEDGLHPNVDGMRIIADYIVAALKEIRSTSALSSTDGDVNLDGKVDKTDVDALVAHIMGESPKGLYEDLADLNGDDKIDATDVVKLIDTINSYGLNTESQLYFDNVDGNR